MKRDRDDPDEIESAPSIYDTRPEDSDLWFLPPDDAAWDLPGPTATPGEATDPGDWLRAESRLGRELARAAAAAARLDERVRQAGGGAVRRLALAEAAALSWETGDRVAVERLALHDLDRADMARDDAGALGAAHWAFRRLSSGAGPLEGLDVFLGRDGTEQDPAMLRWTDGLEALADALPVVRAAWAFRAWRAAGLSPDIMEPAVIAARIGAAGARALPFLPLAQATPPFLAAGSAADRLALWARAVENGALRALMTLDALARWEDRALKATSRLTGRTPGLLIEALMATPALSAGMAARATGASAAGTRRNLAWFERAGLVREITGQGRFRFWQASL